MNEFFDQLLETIGEARQQLDDAIVDGRVSDAAQLMELLTEVIDEIEIHRSEEEEW